MKTKYKASMIAKNVHKGKKTGNRKTKAKKYKVAGRVAVQARNAPKAPMGRVPSMGRAPLTSTAAVMQRMQAMKGNM